MSSMAKLLKENTKGCFLTAHIQNEPWCEIPTYFTDEFYYQLGDQFTLVDGCNNTTTVKFNDNPQHPLLTDGWLRVREVFGIEGNRLMLFSYLGDDLFFVTVYYEPAMDLSRLPPEHSYSLSQGNTDCFHVILTNYAATNYQLTLSAEDGQYIRSTGYDQVRLYGPEGTEIECNVLKWENTEGRQTTKFGRYWKLFCSKNKFKPGDVLRFTFVNKSTSNVIKVYKI